MEDAMSPVCPPPSPPCDHLSKMDNRERPNADLADDHVYAEVERLLRVLGMAYDVRHDDLKFKGDKPF
jgi:hypothetical protein